MNVTLDKYVRRARELHACAEATFADSRAELKIMLAYLAQVTKAVKLAHDHIVKKYNPRGPSIYSDKSSQIECEALDLDLLPQLESTKLKWIPEYNQFCLKINNVVLRGNIGNIYTKKQIYEHEHTPHIVPCRARNRCTSILTQSFCKFYHDPADLYELKKKSIISQEYFQNCVTNCTRNFANTSWLYADKPKFAYMRLFGSRASLDYDIIRLCQAPNRAIERADCGRHMGLNLAAADHAAPPKPQKDIRPPKPQKGTRPAVQIAARHTEQASVKQPSLLKSTINTFEQQIMHDILVLLYIHEAYKDEL
jgi:hypothetical protein